MHDPHPKSYWTMLWRAWRLRCPRCGEGWLFKNWITMYPECPWCELKYEREPGYFLGSIYINYGLTALLVTVLYFALFFSEVVSPDAALWIVAAVAVVFPLCFFRYARSLWLGFDHFWDPTEEELRSRDDAADDAARK
ncbi:MAG: DUF983 domain-containing protein [Pirellulales bacterium]